MNDMFAEKLDDITCKIESIRKSVALVAEFEGRLLSFKQTAGRISEEVKALRNDTEERLRALERNSWWVVMLVGAFCFAGGVVISVLFIQ